MTLSWYSAALDQKPNSSRIAALIWRCRSVYESTRGQDAPLWIVKTRAPFFTAAIVPVGLGSALAWARSGTFDLGVFSLTLAGAVCLHASTNMTNDYFDHTWGSDEINTEFANPFTGGSRLIQMEIVRPELFLRQGIAFFVVCSLIGLVLTLIRGTALPRIHDDHPQELLPANVSTIQIHLLTGLLITAGYILQGGVAWLR